MASLNITLDEAPRTNYTGLTLNNTYTGWGTQIKKINTAYTFNWANCSYPEAEIYEKQWLKVAEQVQGAIVDRIWKNYADITTCGSIYRTYSTASTGLTEYDFAPVRPRTPAERLREMIQARQAPLVIATRKPLGAGDEREQRARQTLRRLVGEEQYRKFLAHGFITVRAKSGKVYKISPGHGMTVVYSPIGKPIEKLCVVLAGNFPPTDSLITRFLMILNDEAHFRSFANVFAAPQSQSRPAATRDERPLPEIFKALKLHAA